MYKKLFLGSSLVVLLLAGAGCLNNSVPSDTTPTSSTSQVEQLSDTSASQIIGIDAGLYDGSDYLATSSIAGGGISGSILPSGTSRPRVVGSKPVAGSASDPATKAYIAALAVYDKNGYRYQFANCSGLPGTFTIKKNVKFMLDNRDGERHVLGFNGTRYTVPAYSYVVASINKPGNFFITCDGGGAAQVKVQN